VFTKSQGTLIGLGAGMLVFLSLIDFRKIAIGLAVVGVIFSLLIPSMRQAVLFQDQANQNRLRLWGYSWTFLTKTPQNFIFGTGVRQFFRKIQKPYYDTRVMERLIYPHNIFLNFWTEIGLVGMLAAVAMIGYIGFFAYKVRANDQVLGAGMVGMLTVLVVHGLVDVPYFKNDLAFLFWILIASIFMVYAHTSQGKTECI
jgi:O-antigen ligase